MGTNYYLVKNKVSRCNNSYHIGKSSHGWLFCFQIQDNKYDTPPVVWRNFEEVKDTLYKYTVKSKEFIIMNEYDEIIDYDDFIDYVQQKQTDEFNINNPDNFTYCENVNGYRFTEGDFA